MTQKSSRPGDATYDYIIVGAGSAGCILAERLSADQSRSVLLVEAGGEDRSFWTRMPLGFGKLFYDRKVNWRYHTESQPELGNKQIYAPRGKLVGGSGAINALLYVRGQARDFDDWESEGNTGWGYRDVLPYFKRLETHWAGESAWHGGKGKIHITRDEVHPISENFIQACEELGHPRNPDFNGSDIEGAGVYDINTYRGRRDSSATAYLEGARSRRNLKVIADAWTERVIFDQDKKAVGVRVLTNSGAQTLYARVEIVLSAGAIDSPSILQRSGIGDGELLQDLQIPVLHHQPQVGRNLQDHLAGKFFIQANCKTGNDQMRSIAGQGIQFLNYVLFRKGLMATTVKSGAFLKTSAELAHPNIQVYFNPLAYSTRDSRFIIEPYSGFMLFFSQSRPSSRGTVEITGPDDRAPAKINPNYLSTAHDQFEAVAGCRLMRDILSTDAMSKVTAAVLHPDDSVRSDEDFLKYFRGNAGSVFHLCGTCRMGSDPLRSVVSPTLKVHGVDGLRVADASVFPNLTSGNINAPTMMVAEKASDMILGH